MKKYYLSFQFIFLFFSLTGFSQDRHNNKHPQCIARIPFKQLIGGIMVVKACISNYTDTLNFLLDTGSGGISIDSSVCEHLKIPHEDAHLQINGIAGTKKVDMITGQSLVFPHLKIDNLNFYINDYSTVSEAEGAQIDGIIGYSFFRQYIVKINFDSSFIEIFEPGAFKYPSGGYTIHPNINNLPIQSVEIQDAKKVASPFFLDTGAGLCFLASNSFIRDSTFLMSKRKPMPINVQGLGGRKSIQITVIKKIRIGPYIFTKVPTYIFDDEFNVTYYPKSCGLIGSDLLRRFNLIINYPQKEIYLKPNSHFNDPFDYTYTGMSLYRINNQVFIEDILKNSPAEKAGFHEDDQVIAINNEFSNDVTHLQNELFESYGLAHVLIRRNGSLFMIKFKMGRIY